MPLPQIKVAKAVCIAHFHRLDDIVLITYWVEDSFPRHLPSVTMEAIVETRKTSSEEVRTRDPAEAVHRAPVIFVMRLGFRLQLCFSLSSSFCHA